MHVYSGMYQQPLCVSRLCTTCVHLHLKKIVDLGVLFIEVANNQECKQTPVNIQAPVHQYTLTGAILLWYNVQYFHAKSIPTLL